MCRKRDRVSGSIYQLSEDVTSEKQETDDVSTSEKDEVTEEEEEEGVINDSSVVILTDPKGVDILKSEHNLVASFCKKGNSQQVNNLG